MVLHKIHMLTWSTKVWPTQLHTSHASKHSVMVTPPLAVQALHFRPLAAPYQRLPTIYRRHFRCITSGECGPARNNTPFSASPMIQLSHTTHGGFSWIAATWVKGLLAWFYTTALTTPLHFTSAHGTHGIPNINLWMCNRYYPCPKETMMILLIRYGIFCSQRNLFRDFRQYVADPPIWFGDLNKNFRIFPLKELVQHSLWLKFV